MKRVKIGLSVLFSFLLITSCSHRSVNDAKREIIRNEANNENERNHLKSVLSLMTQEQILDCADYIQMIKEGKTPPKALQRRIDTLSMEYGILK